jgi:hypothetical protein
MGLVNSLIKQVGREIGRDAYKTIKSNFNKTKNVSDNINSLQQIQNFKISHYDKITFRNLTILVNDVIDKTNPKSFDWEDVILALDKLIDDIKQTIKSSDFLDEIEKLDKEVFVEYQIFKQQHLSFVSKLIEEYEVKVKTYENRNGLVSFLLAFLGLNAFRTADKEHKNFLGVFGIIWFMIGSSLTILQLTRVELTVPHIIGALIIGLIFMSPTLLLSGFRGVSHNFEYKDNKQKLNTLKVYFENNKQK